MSLAHILIVDDEPDIRQLVSEILEDEGYEVSVAENAAAARQCRRLRRPDLTLLDIWMPDTDGVTLLKEWGESTGLETPVIMMSGHGTVETAVEATRLGAYDFIEKPFKADRLLLVVQRAIEAARLRTEVEELRLRAGPTTELLGGSPAINQVKSAAVWCRRSAEEDDALYPSDHVGLLATIDLSR